MILMQGVIGGQNIIFSTELQHHSNQKAAYDNLIATYHHLFNKYQLYYLDRIFSSSMNMGVKWHALLHLKAIATQLIIQRLKVFKRLATVKDWRWKSLNLKVNRRALFDIGN